MIESLLVLLLYIVVVGAVLWLITYLIDSVPMDPRFRSAAKVVIIVVGVIFLILILLRYLPGLPAIP